MRELLPCLYRELEIGGSPFCPALRRFRITRPVKSGIDLDDIEVSRIELQLVGLEQRVEHACPRTRSRGWRIAPSARTDAQNACIVVRFFEEVARCRLSLCWFLAGGLQRLGWRRFLGLIQHHQGDKGQTHKSIGHNNKQ